MITASSGDLQHLGPGVLLLRGELLRTVWYLARLGATSTSRDGGSPASYRDLLVTLERAAAEVSVMSRSPAPDVSPATSERGWSREDEIGTAEAAVVLGCSRRHVTRIASSLDGRRVAGGALMFDRSAVEEYGRRRHEEGTRS